MYSRRKTKLLLRLLSEVQKHRPAAMVGNRGVVSIVIKTLILLEQMNDELSMEET